MSFFFRSAQPNDSISCAQIIREWAAETAWITSVDELEPMAEYWSDRIGTCAAWVAENEEGVVGFCVRVDDNIAALYVSKKARGHGVGKRLLDLAKEERSWITVWAYELNTRARSFYAREGLVEVSRELEKYDDGVELVDVEHRRKR